MDGGSFARGYQLGTRMMHLRDCPSQEAVMVACPLPTGVTLPFPSTVATAALEVDQEMAVVTPETFS